MVCGLKGRRPWETYAPCMGKICAVEKCCSGSVIDKRDRKEKNLRQASLFKTPKCSHRRKLWSDILGCQLTVSEFVCERHFLDKDIQKCDKILLLNGTEETIPRIRWSLEPHALPIKIKDDQQSNKNRGRRSSMELQRETSPVPIKEIKELRKFRQPMEEDGRNFPIEEQNEILLGSTKDNEDPMEDCERCSSIEEQKDIFPATIKANHRQPIEDSEKSSSIEDRRAIFPAIITEEYRQPIENIERRSLIEERREILSVLIKEEFRQPMEDDGRDFPIEAHKEILLGSTKDNEDPMEDSERSSSIEEQREIFPAIIKEEYQQSIENIERRSLIEEQREILSVIIKEEYEHPNEDSERHSLIKERMEIFPAIIKEEYEPMEEHDRCSSIEEQKEILPASFKDNEKTMENCKRRSLTEVQKEIPIFNENIDSNASANIDNMSGKNAKCTEQKPETQILTMGALKLRLNEGLLPEAWSWMQKSNNLIFTFHNRGTFEATIHIEMAENLFATILTITGRRIPLGRITRMTDMRANFRAVEKLQVCTGTGMEIEIRASNCLGVLNNREEYKRLRPTVRCLNCRVLRQKLRKRVDRIISSAEDCKAGPRDKVLLARQKCVHMKTKAQKLLVDIARLNKKSATINEAKIFTLPEVQQDALRGSSKAAKVDTKGRR